MVLSVFAAAALLLIAVRPLARASYLPGVCRYDEDARNSPRIILRPGEGDRNVSLAVHCTQRGAELTWNDGGLSNDVDYIMVVSLCINATSTLQEPDYERIHDGDGTYLQTTSSSIPAQTGSICSFLGCYANTHSFFTRTYYTFDTLTCNWAILTTSAGFATVPTSTPHLRSLSSYPTVSASSPAPHSTLAPSADVLFSTSHSLPDSGTPTVLTTTNAVQPTLSTAVTHSTAMPASPAHTMEDATTTQLETHATTGIRGSTSIKVTTQSLTSIIVLTTTHPGIPTSSPVLRGRNCIHDPVGRSLSTVSPFVWAIPAVVMLVVITATGLLIAGICVAMRRSTSKFQELYLDQKTLGEIDLNYYPVNIIDPPSLKKTVSITSLASTILNSLQWTSGSTEALSDSDTDNTSTTDRTHEKSIVTDNSKSERDPDETERKDSKTGPDGYMNTTLQPNQNTESEAGYMISSVDANDLSRPTERRTSTGADSSEELHETHSQWLQVDPSAVAQTPGQSGYVIAQKKEPVSMNIEDSTPAVDIWDLYSESEKSDSEDSFVEIQLDSECEDD